MLSRRPVLYLLLSSGAAASVLPLFRVPQRPGEATVWESAGSATTKLSSKPRKDFFLRHKFRVCYKHISGNEERNERCLARSLSSISLHAPRNTVV